MEEVDEGAVSINSNSVAWYWVIEYFSTLKQIDACVLRELIELAPDIHDEEFGAKTREAVALRCLEELFDTPPDPAIVDAQANGHFDFSQSCEEVLKCVLRRASISELKSGAPESLRSCAISFIIHKRATMGQTALSKLKDKLVRGNHPFAASLSIDSGLVLANEHGKDVVLALPWRSPSQANADAQISEVQGRLIDTNLDNVDGNADTLVPEVQESLIATTLDNVEGNAGTRVSMVQESLIATTHDDVDGYADIQVSKVKEIHNANTQASTVQERLIATTPDNVDGNADAQVAKPKEVHNADAQVPVVQASLIATTRDNVDGDADAQDSEAQASLIDTTVDDANGNSDGQVAEAQLSLNAMIHENVDGNFDAQLSKAQESSIYSSLDDANGNADSQLAEAQGSVFRKILKNMHATQRNDMRVELCFPLKRKINDFPDTYVDGQGLEIENQAEVDGQCYHYLDSKKLRLDPSCSYQSLVQSLVPQHDNADELVQENLSQIVSKGSKEVRKYSKLGGLQEIHSLENGHDERVGLASDINGNSNSQRNQLEIANNTDKVSQGASGNGTHDCLSVGVGNDTDLRASSVGPALRTQDVDEGKIGTECNLHENEPANTMEHLSAEDTEFDNDGSDNERLKVSKKKGNICNSPCKANHDSSQVSESPILNLCVKCNKEGSILVCSSSNCSLVIHESCLGATARFDVHGNFYCPFCAYSRSLLEYRKFMKSFSSTKKELFSFLNMKS